jgi:GTP pyrophosphokinase
VREPGQATPRRLTPKFAEALRYAYGAHRGQPRKGTRIPYVSHPLAVAAIVLEDGGDETDAIAALLHDAVEDSGGLARRKDIEVHFGPEVTAIVRACTDTDKARKPPWRARKMRHLAHLGTAPARALRVAAADKLHNLRAILRDYRTEGDALWRRFRAPRGRTDILWYHRRMLALFESRGPKSLAAELRRTLDELERAIAEGPTASAMVITPPRMVPGRVDG